MGDTEETTDVPTGGDVDGAADGGDDSETADESTAAETDDVGEDGSNESDDVDAGGEGSSEDESTDTADAEDDGEGLEFEDDGEDPEIRKPSPDASNAEWAAYRVAKKEKEAEESGDDAPETVEDVLDDEDFENLSPEQLKAIDKVISKKLEPLTQKQAEQEVENDIASFLEDNPDFKPFSEKVKRFAMHPSRANLPVKSIFYEVAGDKLMKIGANRAKAADTQAKKGKTGGSRTDTENKGSKSYKDMPLDEFGKELDELKVRPRN